MTKGDDRWLEEQAATHGTTKAALVRQGVQALRDREVPLEEEPLLKLIGDIDDPDAPPDLSSSHDRYLATKS